MKKVLTTILAFVYLTASSGATIHLHYCMGKLMSWDFSNKQGAKCGTCGMEKKAHKGCCKDEQKVFQLEKDQKAAEFAFKAFNISSNAIVVAYSNVSFTYLSSIITEHPTANAPPRSGQIPIYVLNRVFRI